jgi:Concanavalin A-like lectin/glucanases superfamily
MAGDGAVQFINNSGYGASSSTTAFNFSGESLTIEFWYRTGSAQASNWMIGCSNGSTNGFGVRTDSSSHLQLTWGTGAAMSVGPVVPTTVQDGAWHHYALTKGPAGCVCYRDGAQVASSAAGAGVSLTPANLALALNGRQPNVSAAHGAYSEVRVWSVERSSAQITASWNTRIATAQTGLVGRWALSEDAGTAGVESISGNNFALTQPWWTHPPSPFTTSNGGSGGDGDINNALAEWLSVSDGTHLDSAPLRIDTKFDQDGVTIDTKLGNLATHIGVTSEGIATQIAIMSGTAPPPPTYTGTTLPAVQAATADGFAALATHVSAEALGITLQVNAQTDNVVRQLSGHLEWSEDNDVDPSWSIPGDVNAHTTAQMQAVLDALTAAQDAIAGYFGETNTLIAATGAQTTADTVAQVNAHYDEGLLILQGDMNDHEAAINAHTSEESTRLEGAVNGHTDAQTAILTAEHLAQTNAVNENVDQEGVDTRDHVTEEANRVIAAMPTGGTGDGWPASDVITPVNAHTTAEANRVISTVNAETNRVGGEIIASNDNQTGILIAVQSALAAVTLTVNTILEKVEDMVGQLTTALAGIAEILAWVRSQGGGALTPVKVAETTFNGSLYWPQPADYYELDVDVWPPSASSRVIPGGHAFRFLGWAAQKIDGRNRYGVPIAFNSQRVDASGILPDGLLVSVRQGTVGRISAFRYQ